ncbi:MAG: hypothetical protein PHI12_13510 [Dehalococcoidales bacterium]|nr:hypothetical protein [Dehalococcoidales bacterium]
MATIQSATQKYEAKIPQMQRNYANGMSAFFGQDVSGSVPVQSYKNAVQPGTGNRWAARLRSAFGV